jgi:hypothetical protein
VPLSIIKRKLKQRKRKLPKAVEVSDLESDDSFEDKTYRPSSESTSISSGDNNDNSRKRKRKWCRKRIRPLKREENRKYLHLKKIKKGVTTEDKQKSKRSQSATE